MSERLHAYLENIRAAATFQYQDKRDGVTYTATAQHLDRFVQYFQQLAEEEEGHPALLESTCGYLFTLAGEIHSVWKEVDPSDPNATPDGILARIGRILVRSRDVMTFFLAS